MAKKQRTFQDEIQRQLNKPMFDANGLRVQVDGKNATVMEALAKSTIAKAFKDPRIAIALIEKFGNQQTSTDLSDFMKQIQ